MKYKIGDIVRVAPAAEKYGVIEDCNPDATLPYTVRVYPEFQPMNEIYYASDIYLFGVFDSSHLNDCLCDMVML